MTHLVPGTKCVTNSHNALNTQNLAWMVEATEKYGHYPIDITGDG